ncbi:MAG: hypothetical protein ISS93_01090 [Candidatus Aenigmarchaeota archaeon]|nr:hypothetical protein [Candidatus Aenigmarchaeota archaeon]
MTTTKIDLSDNGLRRRFVQIAKQVGDMELQAKAAGSCVYSVISTIVNGDDPTAVITKFFTGFPHGKEIIAALLTHQGEALSESVWAVVERIRKTRELSEAKKVAEALDQEAVHTLASTLEDDTIRQIMEAIAETALYVPEDSSAVQEVCALASTLKGEELIRAMEAVGTTVRWTEKSSAVKDICSLASTLKGEDLILAMEAVADTASVSGNASSVREKVAELMGG